MEIIKYAISRNTYSSSGINIGACKIGSDIIKTQGYGDKGFVAKENFEPTEHEGRFLQKH